MVMKFVKISAVFFALLSCEASCWFFTGSTPETEEENVDKTVSATPPKGKVPFEMTTADENFLAEARSFTKQLSPLDLCHHMVIAKLESTCSNLAEEGIAKLAVQLLNCQSQSEGRQMYTCTDDMSIKDCTQDMDPTTWNAYQIVSNRARALCYSTRQQQFRMKTEHTVNRLVHASQEQLDVMDEVKKSQKEMNDATQGTLHQITESHEELMTRQMALKSAQANVHSQIVTNIRDLVREKAIIAAGNRELMEMAESIHHRLEEASEKLENQEQQQQVNHEELLSDLSFVREKAKEVWEKIDKSSQEVLLYHDETTKNYKETIQNLQRINETVTFVVQAMDKMQSGLENKLNWLTSFVGGTGDQVAVLAVLMLHSMYLIVVVVTAAFLQTPVFSRLLLLLFVPLNAWSEIKHQSGLNPTSMMTFILLTVLCNWFVECAMFLCAKRYESNEAEFGPRPKSKSRRSKQPLMLSRSAVFTEGRRRSSMQDANTVRIDTPDIDRLQVLLENLRKAGEMTNSQLPAEAHAEELSVNEGKKQKSRIVSVNTVASLQQENDAQYADLLSEESEDNASCTEESDGDNPENGVGSTKTSTFKHDNKPVVKPEILKTRADLVKRQILQSPVDLPIRRASPARFSSRSSSPAPRSTTPNGSRAFCTATTKTGQPCRLLQVESNEYCHKHQN